MNIIIKRPLMSEKTMQLVKQGWYTFLVEKSADKPTISRAVEKQFNVDVVSIKTINMKPEHKRNRRGNFKVSGYKKAIVQLKDGQKIGLFIAEEAPKEEGKKEVKEKKSLLKGTKVKIEKIEEKENEKGKK